jgi:hypothetical protein
MENYNLYHYYEANIGPFRSLSQLSLSRANKIMVEIKKNKDLFASRRSDEYLVVRRELEKVARRLFIEKGGRPINVYPHYMTLGNSDWIKKWFREGKELKISIEEFSRESISFTYGDLFPTMRYKDGKPYRETIYTREELDHLITTYGLPQEWNNDGKNGPERYIEVQIWDDKVIGKYL